MKIPVLIKANKWSDLIEYYRFRNSISILSIFIPIFLIPYRDLFYTGSIPIWVEITSKLIFALSIFGFLIIILSNIVIYFKGPDYKDENYENYSKIQLKEKDFSCSGVRRFLSGVLIFYYVIVSLALCLFVVMTLLSLIR